MHLFIAYLFCRMHYLSVYTYINRLLFFFFLYCDELTYRILNMHEILHSLHTLYTHVVRVMRVVQFELRPSAATLLMGLVSEWLQRMQFEVVLCGSPSADVR